MQILSTETSSTTGRHLVIMFGLGMIGSAIRDALLDFQYDLMTNIYFDWLDSAQRDSAFNLIEAACLEH